MIHENTQRMLTLDYIKASLAYKEGLTQESIKFVHDDGAIDNYLDMNEVEKKLK